MENMEEERNERKGALSFPQSHTRKKKIGAEPPRDFFYFSNIRLISQKFLFPLSKRKKK
jgi:hypothetical protein